jgi:PTS system fructose-specific IIA component/PTS system nitrogen regulatory IIA component
MKFADFICNEAIRPKLNADEKSAVIRELVEALAESGEVNRSDTDAIFSAIMKREELGSTGIGRGVAVPHTKHASVKKPVGTVGVSADGIDFNSLDGGHVQLFFLLISPPDRPGDHLRALENISRQLQDDMFCKFLKQSKTAKDISQLLEEADNNQFVS